VSAVSPVATTALAMGASGTPGDTLAAEAAMHPAVKIPNDHTGGMMEKIKRRFMPMSQTTFSWSI
jgi:hypothetical protein